MHKSKVCIGCKKRKVLASFYKARGMLDGCAGRCIKCTKKAVTENRQAKIGYYKAYDKSRNKNPDRVAARKEYSQTPEGILSHKRAVDSWRAKNKNKVSAHNAIAKAKVRKGLIKQPCEMCGSMMGVQAHHDDYAKPLEVMWLCPVHHKSRHVFLDYLETK